VNPKDKGNSIAAWQRTGVFCAATKSRRQAHRVTVQEATTKFPREAGIARYGEPEEIAELMAFLASPGARWIGARRCGWMAARSNRFGAWNTCIYYQGENVQRQLCARSGHSFRVALAIRQPTLG
jgi:hypothetical protein